ncbi:hypothetical protein HPB52_019546 [Rhipicephalus sanguineus]|uniref:CCAAT-binding factor domain-containing protein n=1 Tax=Rhipicephalus sanguineus TaxID=34632 RepID=A0A9D4PFY5_RHISA|nr:hypothetical protein HPB52_019546 [Rhipicephalus sanguineus]
MAAPIKMAGDVRSSDARHWKRQKESLPRPKIFKKTNAKFHNNASKPAFAGETSDTVKFNQILVKPNKKWYEQLPEEGSAVTVADNPPELVSAKRKLAETLFEHDKELYRKHSESRARASDMRWVRTVLAKGALADKVAAHTLLIQESPLHNLASLDSLLAMVTPKGKKECLLAMDALRDLFLSDLLVPDKKLKSFCQRPLASLSGSGLVESRTLLLWYLEDLLKQRYATFLQSVETVSFDQVEKLKLRAVTCMFHMLTYHPERELFLLERLINKLGDRTHAVASRVAHHLTQLTNHHPRMKGAVLTEVDRFVYRPNVASKAQYYALCFLSQLLLSDNDVSLARSLVSFYFTFFKKCVQRSKVADARTMKVLLTGVNRAFPYARASDAEGLPDDQTNLMFRLVHLTDFNIAVQALTLLFQILDAKSSLSDRFYGALYRKALDPALEHSSHQTMFLNLLYKSLKRDTENNRVKAFLKRLLQACLYRSPHLACGILFLVSEVVKLRPTLLDARTFDDSPDDEAPECSVQLDDNDSDGEHYDDAPDDSALDDPSARWQGEGRARVWLKVAFIDNDRPPRLRPANPHRFVFQRAFPLKKESARCSPSAEPPALAITADGRNPISRFGHRFCTSVAAATWPGPRHPPDHFENPLRWFASPTQTLWAIFRGTRHSSRAISLDDSLWRRRHGSASTVT